MDIKLERAMELKSKIVDITERIEVMQTCIDQAMTHNIGSKLSVKMNPIPLNKPRPEETVSEGFIELMMAGIPIVNGNSTQPFKNAVEHIPMEVNIDESETVLMVGALLNLSRRRRKILVKEYNKIVKELL